MVEPPISVTVRRGATVESRHLVHAVAVLNGRVVEAAGDPDLVTFLRSAAKPLQALPLARVCKDLEATELAIASASHLARPDQLNPVRSLLVKASVDEGALECGPAGEPPARIKHNCSGKHAGMLLLAHAKGWDTTGYRLADHPVQCAMLSEMAAAADVDPQRLATAVDGCGVVTFALPLRLIAHAFAHLERSADGRRIAAAMRAHPDLIRGPGATDTELMGALSGWTAKGGAEGLFCATSGDGLAIALKATDGAGRALAPALAAFLGRFELDLPQLAVLPVDNSRGEQVGQIQVE